MHMLDSRASRISPSQALLTLHADYIGGRNANYRRWYIAAQMDIEDGISANMVSESERSERWRVKMDDMLPIARLKQVALYLLLWGEAAHVRYMPECLCFIFKCAEDYLRSTEGFSMGPIPEGLYLRQIVKPLYQFVRDQGYEARDGKFVRRERDHRDIIGYDDVNQLFWHPDRIARIVLYSKVRSITCSAVIITDPTLP